MDELKVPVSVGEFVDKMSILQIKSERISDSGKLENIKKELNELMCISNERLDWTVELKESFKELKNVNESLWVVEDELRDFEREGQFDEAFTKAARSVYFLNDKRAELKKTINRLTGSKLVEEKSYQSYNN